MANIYYNEKIGLPEFKVGPLDICFTGFILLMSVIVLFISTVISAGVFLIGLLVEATLFVINTLFFPSGIDNKKITKEKN